MSDEAGINKLMAQFHRWAMDNDASGKARLDASREYRKLFKAKYDAINGRAGNTP